MVGIAAKIYFKQREKQSHRKTHAHTHTHTYTHTHTPWYIEEAEDSA